MLGYDRDDDVFLWSLPPRMPDEILKDTSVAKASRRRGISDLLAVMGLWGFAVVQPVVEQLGLQLPFLIHHRFTPLDVAVFLTLLCVAVPGGIFAGLALLRRIAGPFAADAAFHALAALATVCLVLRAARLLGLHGAPLVAATVLAAAGAGWASVRFSRGLRAFLGLCALSIPLAVVLFVGKPAVLSFLVEHWVSAYPDVQTDSDVPVVLVILDEFPLVSLLDTDQRVDAQAFPHFADLAGRSTWFRNATTVLTRSEESVVTLLTGRVAKLRAAPILSNYPRNLFTLLARSHDVRTTEQITQLTPTEFRAGIGLRDRWQLQKSAWADLAVVYAHLIAPPSLAEKLPDVQAGWAHFLRVDERTLHDPMMEDAVVVDDPFERLEEFESFLERIEAGERPGLDFLHSFLPHMPHVYLPSGKLYGGPSVLGERTLGEAWATDPEFSEQVQLRHLLQVQFVDTLLGRLVDRLEEQGLWNRCLFVVVADHGLAHVPGRSRRWLGEQPDATLLDEIARIPFFVKLPEQQTGRIDDRNVQTIDLLPTIADVLGVDPGWTYDGASAFQPGEEPPNKVLISKTGRSFLLPATFQIAPESLERRLRVDLSSGDVDGYPVGRFGRLVGRERSTLEVAGERDVDVVLDQLEVLRRVDLDRDFLPTDLTGSVHGYEPEGSRPAEHVGLALLLQGQIAAATELHVDNGGTARFSALVSESKLREGANEVDVLWIEEIPGQEPRLYEVSRAPQPPS